MSGSTITSSSTSGGVPVVVENIPGSQSAAFMIGVATGSRDEHPEIFGLSHLLEHTVFRETETRDSYQMAKEMEGAGGELNAFTGREMTAFYGITIKETAPTAMDMVGDIVAHPKINEEDTELEKKIVLQELSMIRNEPDSYIHDLFESTLWRGHALSQDEGGDEKVVAGLTSADLRAYYEEKYLIPNLAVYAAGAIDVDETVRWAEEVGTLSIVHTNDSHGGYGFTDASGAPVGYYAAVAGLAQSVDADLVLDAGDTFHGDSFATITNGESVARLMAAAGYDATTPGNHDWSYGSAQLLALSAQVPVLASNVLGADGEPYFQTPYVVRDVTLDDGETIQVGVLGVIDEAFYTSTPSYNVAGLTFADPVAYANEAAEELRTEQGCELVVVITHNADPQELAEKSEGIDAVIAGHEHVLIDDVVTSADGTEVPVVEADSHIGYVGELELTVDRAEDGTYSVAAHEETAHTAESLAAVADADITALTMEIMAENEDVLLEPVGESSQAYPYPDADYDIPAPGGWEMVRTEDTPIGHVITASYLSVTGADLAFENAGGIRGGVHEGTVTKGDLVSISPYGNTLSTYQMTGQQILDVLETSLEISSQCRDVLAQQLEALEAGEDPMQYTWPDNSGSVLVSGGATMKIDWSKPQGERIRSISVGGQALDPVRTYTVAMNSYLPGCDEYPLFATLASVQDFGTCEQALRSFIGQDGWEAQVYELSGTVSYIEAEEQEEPEPADPEERPDEKPETGPKDEEKPEQMPDAKPTTKPSTERIPATGDPASALGLAVLLGSGATSVAAGVRMRRAPSRRPSRIA